MPWPTVARHAGLVAATFFVIRVLGAGWSGGFPIFFPDSSSFLAVAGRGPFGGRFWFDERPIGFPLLAWLFGRSVRLIVLAQTVLYVASFATLIVVVVRSLRSWIAGAVAVVGIASVATQPRFALWNTHVLSESLAMSLGVWTLAAWWWFAAAPDRRRLGWATVATGLWLVTRDSNFVPVVAIIVPTLLIVSRRWGQAPAPVRRRLVLAAGALTAIGAYAFASQDVSERNRYPTMNNVGERVLPDAATTEWFVDRGMPLPDALRELTGRNSFDESSAMLVDDELAEFRSWAEGPGQRVQALSLVARAGFWLDLMDREIRPILLNNFTDYDEFGVRQRLPSTWFGHSGPRTVGGFAGWTIAAAIGIGAAMTSRVSRPLAVVTAIGLFATAIDAYVTYAGDSVEVGRHLVGTIARATLLLTLGAVLGIDRLAVAQGAGTSGDEVATSSAPRRSWRQRVPAIAAGGLTVVLTAWTFAAIFGNELRAQNFDPLYMRVLVERTQAFGGSYYANGVHNKGPLEPFVYEVGSWLGGSRGWWLVLSIFVAVVALALAAIAAVVARIAGAGRTIAACVAIGVAFHFALASSDYSGSLYARHLCVVLLAAAFAIAIVERCWSTRRRGAISAALIGVLIGLAVQTVLSSIFAGAVVIALALASTSRRYEDSGAAWQRWPRVLGLVTAGAVAVLVSAPLYYAVRGSVQEFWAGWWTYAGYSSSATGRSLAGQLGLAWDQLYAYYQRFPLSLVILGGFGAATFVRWGEYTSRQRQVRLATVAWIAAAWFELAVSQRYSSHYYSVLAVPTWIAFAQLAADGERLVRDRGRTIVAGAAVPLAATLAFVYVGGATPMMEGLARASRFTSVGQLRTEREASASPASRAEQAVLDLVSSPGDPMLAWTMAPWTYLDHERVSATRFIWKSFLVGEVYLAGSGPQFVLPRTWEWFAEDLEESRPVVYHADANLPVDESTPFAAYVAEHFHTSYVGSLSTIALHDDVATQLLGSGRDAQPLAAPAGTAGWTVVEGGARYTPSTAAMTEAEAGAGVGLGRGWCRRMDGLIADGLAPSELQVIIRDNADAGLLGSFSIGGGTVTSAIGATQLETVTWAAESGQAGTRMSVVVGDETAVLVLDGSIVGAVPLPAESVSDPDGPELLLVGGQTELELTDAMLAESGPLGTTTCR